MIPIFTPFLSKRIKEKCEAIKGSIQQNEEKVAEVGDQVVVLTPGDLCFVAGTILAFTPRRVKVGFERGAPRHYLDASLMFHRKNTGVPPGREVNIVGGNTVVLETIENKLKEVAAELKELQESLELRITSQRVKKGNERICVVCNAEHVDLK